MKDSIDNNIELEFLTEEEINTYCEAVTKDTPDLWDRIDVGFDSELKASSSVEKKSKKINYKIIGLIAACTILCLVAKPAFDMARKSEETMMYDTLNVENDSVEESKSVNLAPTANEDMYQESAAEVAVEDEASDYAFDSELRGAQNAENFASGATDDKTVNSIGAVRKDATSDSIEESDGLHIYSCKVKAYVSKDDKGEYFIKIGDVIEGNQENVVKPTQIYSIDNIDEFEKMIIEKYESIDTFVAEHNSFSDKEIIIVISVNKDANKCIVSFVE